MARYHDNIEPSIFRDGQYVGYGSGLVWRIRRNGSHGWNACATTLPAKCVSARTLREVADKIRTVGE